MAGGRVEDGGFTLVLLLTVAVVLGALAAIAMPQLLSQRRQAWETTALSDLRNAVIELEQIMLNGGDYGTGDPSVLQSSDGVSFSFGSRSSQTYCLQVDHRRTTGIDFHFDSTDSLAEPGACQPGAWKFERIALR